ncbi:hypothetical protein MD484_g2342, partial [Candolleomyces efflorescens]
MPQMHDLNRILTSRDLTGQVTALTEEPDIVGFYNEIYMGVWQTNGQIAIRVPRALSRSDDFRDRFEREASLWGPFDHPNLLPLWGIIDFQSRLCAVSPWMANGTAIEFVNRHSNVDFFQMLSEITEDLRKEQEFREVIITASIDFNTPKGFFKMLRECFEEAEEDRRRNPENMAATQINVFEVMSYWITHAQLPVNSDLLWEMQEFCEAVTERTSAPTMLKRAEELACLIRIRQGAAPRMTSVPRGAQTSMTSQDVTPQGLALALTLLEGDKFRLISPSDYLAHLCGRSERTNVDAAMSVNGKIKLWVQQNIVHFDALDPRVSVMTFYINTAKFWLGQELRNLRNYQSLMAIAQALDSPPIRRLALTRRSLKKDAPTHLEELMKLCDVSDQTFYRKVLSEVPDSPYRNYCIPCVAMHLEELRAVLHANERTIERDGQTLINVQRYTRFMHQVQQLFHLPPPDLERFRHQGELAYLESKLADVQIGDVADDEVLAKAISLEGIENSLDSKRAPQFRDLGFSVGKQTREDLTGH